MKDNKKIFSLSLKQFNILFGSTTLELKKYCAGLVNKDSFRYRKASEEEKNEILLTILNYLFSDKIKVAGKDRQIDWNNGWKENLEDFKESNYDLKGIIPKYFKRNVPVRLNEEFIIPQASDFIYNVTNLFQNWLFSKYFKDFDAIHEFGSGTGRNLVLISSIFPEKKLYGYDWTKSSLEIINLLKIKHHINIEGKFFDFFNPDQDIKFSNNSAVLTFGALEQIGADYQDFLKFILKKEPQLVINVECLNELYDSSKLYDYLGLQYHLKRKYLLNYLTALRKLESQGKIIIIRIHHQRFGNIFNDTHSYIIWRKKF